MLRQTKDLQDRAIVATHGAIGAAADFYFDDETWAQGSVEVDLTRNALKHAPSHDPALPLAPGMEIVVYQHYGRAGYWSGASLAA